LKSDNKSIQLDCIGEDCGQSIGINFALNDDFWANKIIIGLKFSFGRLIEVKGIIFKIEEAIGEVGSKLGFVVIDLIFAVKWLQI
jgi:hypothetical protein